MKRKKLGSLKTLSRKMQAVLFGHLGAFLLGILFRTVRWQRNDLEKLSNQHPLIAAFWHGRQLMLAPLFSVSQKKWSTAVLISAHTDGRIIARAIRWFGLDSVMGSSSAGAAGAFRTLLQRIVRGQSIAITPDGPRGPRHKAKAGVIKLSQMTKLPIYPMTYAASSVWQFKSWDGMILPKPFSRGICLVGEPMHIADDADEVFQQTELEKRLNDLSDTAEALLR